MISKQSSLLVSIAIVGVIAFNALVVTAAFADDDDGERMPSVTSDAAVIK
jgi:hypothetical protein